MNFLAHAYLSFGDPEFIVGNLIADTVKGKQIEAFPAKIQKGIQIHREIDSFTDHHPINKEVKLVFREVAGRYDSSFLDVAYDHFLAIDNNYIPQNGWKGFAQHCYTQVEKYGEILPQPFASMYMYMRNEDWLNNYQNKWMIERSFERLTRRANYLEDSSPVYEAFEDSFSIIQTAFKSFFPELKAHSQKIILSLSEERFKLQE